MTYFSKDGTKYLGDVPIKMHSRGLKQPTLSAHWKMSFCFVFNCDKQSVKSSYLKVCEVDNSHRIHSHPTSTFAMS